MSPETVSPPNLKVPIADLLQASRAGRHFREQQKPVDAVPTPFPAWNSRCRDDGGGVGIARGWHVTIAANTGAGKSLLALNLASHAIRHGEKVGFVSLEMSEAQIATRLYAILTKTDVRYLERGNQFSESVANRVVEQVLSIAQETGSSFRVNERPIYDIDAIQGLMRYLHESHDCGYFIVDYLQLAGARDTESLYAEVSNVSARVREFAKRMDVVTVGLSQLNRQTSRDYTSRPRVQGLIGSSSLENDSDQVLLLDHTRYRKSDRRAQTWALLGKNRHGGAVEIPIEWSYKTLRVRQATAGEADDWP